MKELVIGRKNDKTVLTISLNDLNKVGLAGGKPYTITIPNPCADVELENEWRQTTLSATCARPSSGEAFQDGNETRAPLEAIAELTKGLLPI